MEENTAKEADEETTGIPQEDHDDDELLRWQWKCILYTVRQACGAGAIGTLFPLPVQCAEVI